MKQLSVYIGDAVVRFVTLPIHKVLGNCNEVCYTERKWNCGDRLVFSPSQWARYGVLRLSSSETQTVRRWNCRCLTSSTAHSVKTSIPDQHCIDIYSKLESEIVIKTYHMCCSIIQYYEYYHAPHKPVDPLSAYDIFCQ